MQTESDGSLPSFAAKQSQRNPNEVYMKYFSFDIQESLITISPLTAAEKGIYFSLTLHYLHDEKPPACDIKKLRRTLCLKTPDEFEALDNILGQFFEVSPSGFVSQKIERDINNVLHRSDKARLAAFIKNHGEAAGMRLMDEFVANRKKGNNVTPIKGAKK
jgi:uncharacterized protein YdaU (DUF1376 family)